jgi:hypothetical protein
MPETDRDRVYRLQNPQQDFDPYPLILNHDKKLRESSEFSDYDKMMHEDPILSRYIDTFVSSGMSGGLMDTSKYIFFIVNELIIKYCLSDDKFDEGLFNSLYCDLEYLFYKKEMPFKVITPLHHFGYELDVIKLNEGLTIRKISAEERKIFARLQEGLGLSWEYLEEYEYGIEYHYMQKISIGFPPEISWDATVRNLINKLILALRLFKEGSVGFTSQIWTPKLRTAVKGGGMYSPYPPEPTYGKKYELDQGEVSFFQDFWHALMKNWNLLGTIGNKNLSLALRRFDSAYARRSNDDKMIDYSIAFEALFSKSDDTRDSLTHKLALRFSRLVENDFVERKNLFGDMKDLYSKRSRVVHGDPAPVTPADVEEIERYVRKAINIYMNQYYKKVDHNNVIDRLDLG